MDFSCTKINYNETGYFSKVVSGYLSGDDFLKNFYLHTPTIEGIKNAIAARKSFSTNRKVLVEELQKQYQEIQLSSSQNKNLQSLLNENTFTVTTAHQPNIFTGPLYFIYKIFHAIKLADELNKQLANYHFVPVYYMGSEDADLNEIGTTSINNKKIIWQTNQTGAVGRMRVDKAFINLINEIHGQIGVLPFGNELTEKFRKAYSSGKTIQQATFELVNDLFAEYGLLIVIPDNANLKKLFQSVVEKEITEQFSHGLVEAATQLLSQQYKVQAKGRELNLFYLIDDKRERIEVERNKTQGSSFKFQVSSLDLEWNRDEILKELNEHPERFSANVILRGVFQETILPNIVFIGGGGELAYWLELKNVFNAVNVPYPVLLLRNSFLIVNKNQSKKIAQLGFCVSDFFKTENDLLNELVKRKTDKQINLTEEIAEANELYQQIQNIANEIDITLTEHVKALQAKTLKKLENLEKKLLRAEKNKFETEQQQIKAIKTSLFPGNNLQERVENFSSFYAQFGKDFMQTIYNTSPTLEQIFEIISIK